MKHLLITLLGCIILVQLNAQEIKELTLAEAIEYAMNNNISIKNSILDVEDASEQIVEQRAVGIPRVDASVNWDYALALPVSLIPNEFLDPSAPPGEFTAVKFGTRNNFVAGIEANTLIFDFTYLTGLKAAKLYKVYAGEQLNQQRFDIKYLIIDAYLPALIIQENIETVKKNISNIEKLRKETQALYEAGFVEQLDVDRLDLTLTNLATELENLNRQGSLIYNVLKFKMGYPMDQEIIAVDDMEALFELATDDELSASVNYETKPEYRVLKLGKELNEMNITLNKAAYYPSLSGFASFNGVAQGDDLINDPIWSSNSYLGLSLKVPIFDGLQKKAKVNRARLDLAGVVNRQIDLERAITLEVQNARTNYISAIERWKNQKKNVELAERIHETTQVKYREGVGSSVEITQAEYSLFDTQSNYIRARYDLLVAKMALDKALGK